MQSKQINLKLAPSKLPLIALLLAFIFGYVVSYYFTQLRYAACGFFIAICLFWLYKYLTFKEYNLIINTESTLVVLNNLPAQVIKFQNISWWLSIIYLTVLNKPKKIYLFVDSVTFKAYKSFKMYSLWA